MNLKTESTKSKPDNGPLSIVNEQFHKHYNNKKKQYEKAILRGDILLFVRLDSRLISMCGDKLKVHDINTKKYHDLKALTHATLAAYYILSALDIDEAVPLLRSWTKSFQQCNDIINCAEVSILMDRLLDKVEKNNSLEYSWLLQFTQGLEPLFANMMMQAANDEIDNIVKTLDLEFKIHHKKSTETYLVVLGGHQPRYKELAKLVFKKWYNELDDHIVDAEHHVRYLEGGSSLDDAISLIATVITDRELAQLFLGSVKGLDQDALGIIGEKALEKYWAHREVSRSTELP
ncbi:hypothetical protein VT06_16725 [Arsukibacterium sp. MJ3]|uniref:hypothetical protein n=1 Tax=Arsukibacterium sp. MJ3 TaxID=1632859 RepID=UPI0006271FA8|nr:hypothetical protein [Arsukibacterium sp. MJ3]KKO47508.1 hypothetical protein VT06_16725 [Arsukibacterium sp. MJ3]